MLLSVLVLSLVASIVGPDLLTVTMLLILEPVALIPGPIRVVVDSIPMGLIILPLTIVDIAVCMDQSASAVGLVSPPVPFIERAIHPDLHTTPILHALLIPFTLILCSIVKGHDGSVNSCLSIVLRSWLKVEWFETLTDLHDEAASCHDLSIRGTVRDTLIQCCVSGLKSILFSDDAASDHALEVPLDGDGCLVFNLLWIHLSVSSDCLLLGVVKFGAIRGRSTARVSHLSNYSYFF